MNSEDNKEDIISRMKDFAGVPEMKDSSVDFVGFYAANTSPMQANSPLIRQLFDKHSRDCSSDHEN